MKSQCLGQKKSLTVQLSSRPMRRIALYSKVCSGLITIPQSTRKTSSVPYRDTIHRFY